MCVCCRSQKLRHGWVGPPCTCGVWRVACTSALAASLDPHNLSGHDRTAAHFPPCTPWRPSTNPQRQSRSFVYRSCFRASSPARVAEQPSAVNPSPPRLDVHRRKLPARPHLPRHANQSHWRATLGAYDGLICRRAKKQCERRSKASILSLCWWG